MPLQLRLLGPHRLRRAGAVLIVLATLITGWMWLRDSSVVRVTDVQVSGVSGPQSAAIESAVRNAAHDMTTLHVRADELRSALGPYAIVKDVQVAAHFPHRLDVTVVQHVPVAIAVVDGQKVPVAADGTLLRQAVATGLPVLPLKAPPAGARLTDARALTGVDVLAAAPPLLRRQVAKVFLGPRGLTARMRTGTALYFGNGERLRAKWAAAVVVLADPSSRGATSLDLRVPERPAAGGLEQISSQESAGPTGQAGPAGAIAPVP